jgi:hypothetical protein
LSPVEVFPIFFPDPGEPVVGKEKKLKGVVEPIKVGFSKIDMEALLSYNRNHCWKSLSA